MRTLLQIIEVTALAVLAMPRTASAQVNAALVQSATRACNGVTRPLPAGSSIVVPIVGGSNLASREPRVLHDVAIAVATACAGDRITLTILRAASTDDPLDMPEIWSGTSPHRQWAGIPVLGGAAEGRFVQSALDAVDGIFQAPFHGRSDAVSTIRDAENIIGTNVSPTFLLLVGAGWAQGKPDLFATRTDPLTAMRQIITSIQREGGLDLHGAYVGLDGLGTVPHINTAGYRMCAAWREFAQAFNGKLFACGDGLSALSLHS